MQDIEQLTSTICQAGLAAAADVNRATRSAHEGNGGTRVFSTRG